MKTVKQILKQFGYDSVDDLELEEEVTVENNGYMDLTVQKTGENRVVVGHYYRQNTDLMADPEVVFKTRDREWIPIRYTQSPGIHQHDENGLRSVQKFVEQWSHNLRTQGFVDAAKEQTVEDKSMS